MRDEIAKADPNDNGARTSKGDIDEVLGSVHAVLGNREEVISHFKRALAVRESLVAAAPDSSEDKYDLGRRSRRHMRIPDWEYPAVPPQCRSERARFSRACT